VAATSDGKLYTVSGRSPGVCDVCNTVLELDLATGAWTYKAFLPGPRSDLGLAAATNGKLYAAGGVVFDRGVAFVSLREVYEYDPATNIWTEKASMPSARHGHGLVLAPNGRLYAVGGHFKYLEQPQETLAEVVEYNPFSNTWTQKTPMPTAREYLGAALAANGKLYAVGGFNIAAVSAGGCGGVCGTVEEYDPTTNVWTAATTVSGLPGLYHPATAVADGRLYVFGGEARDGVPRTNVYEVTPGTTPGTDRVRTVASMPTARFAASATVAQGKVYVVGGYNATGYSPVVEVFTPPSGGVGQGSWAALAPLQVARSGAGLAASRDGTRIYLAGGDGVVNGVANFLTSVDEYTIAANTWRSVAPLPSARDGLALALGGDDRLYALGGNDATTPGAAGAIARVDAFTVPTMSTGQGAWQGRAALPGPRSLLAAVSVPNASFYALGGWNGTAATADVFEYDHAANAWSTQNSQPPRAPFPNPRYAFGAGLAGDRLFVVGGSTAVPNTDLLHIVNAVNVAIRDEIPTVSAGGPYIVTTSGSVQLTASGSDPEGGPLTFAWSLNSRLLYETPGQSVTVPGAVLPVGNYPIRVRAVDNKGGYAVAETYLSVTCDTRTRVTVQTAKQGAGAISVTLRSGTGSFSGVLRLGQSGRPIQNATVSVQGGPSGITRNAEIPISGTQVVLTVTRRAPGPVTVPLAVMDGCGEWRTFVGFGTGV
jgi:N-acetylneuraminic acid mutarotase